MSPPDGGVGSDVPRRPDPAIPFGSVAPTSCVDDDELDALVNEILGSKPKPIDWSRLTVEAAAEALEALDSWVRWLVERYVIDPREIPPCWSEHGELLEELSALHTAHRAAFDPAGPPTGPADWHTVLANTRARLQLTAARTGCRAGEHRPPNAPEWVRAGA